MRTPRIDAQYGDVEMSPRATRAYTYLRDRGVYLTTWSTDECVLRDLARIRAAREP